MLMGLGVQIRFMRRVTNSRQPFLDHFGGPKEAKIDHKSSLEGVKNEEGEQVYFLHPSHAESLLLDPMGAKMEPK